MHVEIENITGWKWNDLDDIIPDEALCQTHFGLPLGHNDITRNCIGAIENKDVMGNVLFYYMAYSEPDQFEAVLGAPINFAIIIITD